MDTPEIIDYFDDDQYVCLIKSFLDPANIMIKFQERCMPLTDEGLEEYLDDSLSSNQSVEHEYVDPLSQFFLEDKSGNC